MELWELIAVAVGLAMDAAAVALGKGLALPRFRWRYAFLTGLWFGLFQAAMPFLGYLLGTRFSDGIRSVDHWVAFVLLGLIGCNMIREARAGDEAPIDSSFSPRRMLPLAVATSIDALAIGVTLAFLQVHILSAVALIGGVAFILSCAGVRLGAAFGGQCAGKAETAGGAVLILLGLKTLVEHLVS